MKSLTLSLLFVFSLVLILSSCTSPGNFRSLETDAKSAAKVLTESKPVADTTAPEDLPADNFKSISLDKIGLTLDVPADWDVLTESRPGGIFYFIGMVEDGFEFDYSQVPVFSEFYSNSRQIHGVYIQPIAGTMESIELELRVNAPHYPVISETDLSDGNVVGKSVLMKDEFNGYYLYYGIGRKSKPGLKIETRSRLFRNENDEISFDDEKDNNEIAIILNSLRFD